MNSLIWQDSKSIDSDDSPKRSMIDSCIYSMRVKQNAQERRDGESMFEFLKRKKKFALEQQISKSRQNSKSRCEPPTDRSAPTIDPLESSKVKHRRSSMIDADKFESVSSKKVTFRENDTSVYQSTGRSFFEMVSPFKRKTKLESYASEEMGKENSALRANSSKKFTGKQLTMQKRSILSSVQNAIQKSDSFCKDVSFFRAKAQSIYHEAIAMLNEIDTLSKDKIFKRKLEELKRGAKIVDKIYSDLAEKDPSEAIGRITSSLIQKLNSIEAHANKTLEFQSEGIMQQFKAQHRQEISQLEKAIKAKDREIEALNKKLSKLHHDRSEKQAVNDKKHNQSISKNEQKLRQLQQKYNELSSINEQLHTQKQQLKSTIKQLQKVNRTIQAQKMSLLKSFQIEKQQIASRKQSYLLDQMTAMKRQFQLDMNELTELYRLKEIEYNQKIANQQSLLQQYQRKMTNIAKSEDMKQEQLMAAMGNLERHKIQNDNLLRQLHETTDEAYLYWTALKDMKTLSTRLGLFNRFVRIYEDIRFQDSSFR